MKSATSGGAAPAVSLLHEPASYVAPLVMAAVFSNSQPVELELGAGDGSFIVKYAAQHPERNFIAVERLMGRLRKIDRKGRKSGLMNLKAVRIEAAYFLKYLIPEASLSALHVYFPDPWPKRRHHKNRLIQPAMCECAAVALKPGGVAYLRTDNAPYFEQMLEVFRASKAFKETQTPEELAAVVTDFERDFNASGIPTLRAAFVRG